MKTKLADLLHLIALSIELRAIYPDEVLAKYPSLLKALKETDALTCDLLKSS